jgi:hypothetical protein
MNPGGHPYANYRVSTPVAARWRFVYNAAGFNGAAALAWYIEPASVTVSTGFRYQYLHYYIWRGRTPALIASGQAVRNNYDTLRNDDLFYGITMSAVYTVDC